MCVAPLFDPPGAPVGEGDMRTFRRRMSRERKRSMRFGPVRDKYLNSQIFLYKYIPPLKYSLEFRAMNIFIHSFIEFLHRKCLNIFKYSNISR